MWNADRQFNCLICSFFTKHLISIAQNLVWSDIEFKPKSKSFLIVGFQLKK